MPYIPTTQLMQPLQPVSMVVLFDQVLTADAATFDVQNIPSGYKHLLITGMARTTEAAVGSSATIRLNNDSGANYDGERLTAADTVVTGIGTVAGTSFAINIPGASAHSGAASPFAIEIPGYADTTFHKSLLVRSGLVEDTAADSRIDLRAIRWRSTSAINRVTLTAGSGNLLAGSRLTIYGMGGQSQDTVVSPDGWTATPDTWTYASATTFTVNGDHTAKFSKGTRIRLIQSGSQKYFVVVDNSYSAGVTTVTITGGSDYTLANAVITDNFYSYAANPQGYPTWFNYVPPNETGWSDANPWLTAKFSVLGKVCTLEIYGEGTSDSTSTSFDAPIATTDTSLYYQAVIRNNGTFAVGRMFFNSSIQIIANPSITGGTWTASGTKTVSFVLPYEI